MSEPERAIIFAGTTKADIAAFPDDVQEGVLFALETARTGGKALNAVPLTQFQTPGVFEIREAFDGNAYRAVYYARVKEAVYVLHAFMKKSHRGKEIPRPDVNTIERRLKRVLQETKQR